MQQPGIVVQEIPASGPFAVARRLAHRPHLLVLESVDRSAPARGRYSFVSADPVVWKTHDTLASPTADPFAELAAILREFPCETIPGLPPFQGGVAGLWGYGLQHAVERLPRPRFDEFAVPDMAVGLYDWVVAFDHVQSRSWLISTGYPERDPARRKIRANERFRQVLDDLSGSPKPPVTLTGKSIPAGELAPQFPLPDFPGVTSNFSPDGFREAIRRAVDYVNAGDCFQVNVSQRLLTPVTEHPLDLYARLRERTPAPFAGYLELGDFAVVSASPERFLQVTEGNVLSRPIKGTRPRGTTPEEDAAIKQELLASPKDRAENVMIVDLLRNDLGRACQFGSVTVPRVCELETYSYVHHLVSEVRGKLAEGHTPLSLLKGAFPGGSVTGAPKVRAMEIIAELEPTARGPYCGSLGYVGFDGAMDTNILIRTFTAGRGWLQFPMGGGIVADSTPEREYQETLHKAAGLLRALE
ncbi:aminodeoxychorismate synthase component I [Zavarzinella formosa]|uniref:aminodeoxychorismate synthase component I n=1 Tax=Zavarzinella formosa TaxID=360055 RepID=UPI0002E6109E|nr:aminodeoxychorismate synthase component I [Zavarzinella formosa]